jgi:hypothetical protein
MELILIKLHLQNLINMDFDDDAGATETKRE